MIHRLDINLRKVKEVHRIINDIVIHFRPKAEGHHVAHLQSIVYSLVRADQIDFQSLFTTVISRSLFPSFF